MTMRQESRADELSQAWPTREVTPGVNAIDHDSLALEAIEQFRGDRDFIFGLARGFSVLLSLSTIRRHMTISEVARRTGLSRPTVRRCLHTLTKIGFAAADGTGGYYLRPRVLSFSHTYLSASPVALLAQPLLDALSNTTLQACSLAVLDGQDIAYLARSMSSPIIAPQLNVGRRQPAYCTSIGHVLLANLPRAQLERYIAGIRFYQYTAHTINSKAALRAAIERVRNVDFSYVAEQTGPNLCSLATPVRDQSGTCVAAINVIVHGAMLTPEEMIDRYLPALNDVARRLSLVLPSNAC
ncbi:MAG: helix-turn-helix domain-containing protein [Burkholderiales bacterium]|nr:helix-turn-helix domain-containing protein [Burkholderiales bacterium]